MKAILDIIKKQPSDPKPNRHQKRKAAALSKKRKTDTQKASRKTNR